MWVRFMDMHSGGGLKEKWQYIYIEANSVDEAKVIFYNRFGHNPERVTCTCCGDDYSISDSKTLREASGYDRGCEWVKDGYVEKQAKNGWNKYQTLKEYRQRKDVLILSKKKIKPEERVGDVPTQGYVWI